MTDKPRQHPARIARTPLPSGRVFVYHAKGTLSISSFGADGILGSPVRAEIGDQIEVVLDKKP